MNAAAVGLAPATFTLPGSSLPKNHVFITLSIMLATIMQTLDSTIANVALPHMQGTMAATHDQMAWILTSYIVATAVMTAPTGFLAERFGRKQVFIVSVVGFTLASMLCGTATNVTEMVMFRLLQGALGAGVVPLSQAVLLDTYPPHKQGQAMSIWSVGIMLGPILGPTLGGYLTDLLSWRWVFYINVPIGIVTVACMAIFLPESTNKRKVPFDWTGFALLGIAVGAAQLALDRGESQDWFESGEIIVETVLAITTLYLFVVHLMTSRSRPFFNLAMLRDRNFVTGVFFIFMLGMLMMSTMVMLPPFLQQILGYPVATAGELLVPRGLGTIISTLVVGRLISRIDARALVVIGLALSAAALWQMSHFNLDTTSWMIMHTGFLQGLGLGLIMVPISTLSFATLSMSLRNEATALFALLRNIGGSFGISIVMSLLSSLTQINHAELGENLSLFNQNLLTMSSENNISLVSPAGLAQLDAQISQQATIIAYLNDFTFLTYVTLLAMPLLLMMRKPTTRQAAPAISVHE